MYCTRDTGCDERVSVLASVKLRCLCRKCLCLYMITSSIQLNDGQDGDAKGVIANMKRLRGKPSQMRLAVAVFFTGVAVLSFGQNGSSQSTVQTGLNEVVIPERFLEEGRIVEASADPIVRDQVLETLVVGLKQSELSLSQLDAQFEVLSISDDPVYRDSPDMCKRRTRLALDGPKMRYEWEVHPEVGKQDNEKDNLVSVWDGSFCYYYYPGLSVGGIVPEKLPRMVKAHEFWLLLMLFTDDTSFSELLKRPGTEYEGHQTIDGIDCFRVSTPWISTTSKVKVKRTVWISPVNGYRAKRIKILRKDTADHVTGYSITEVATFVQYPDGTWLPIQGQHGVVNILQDGTEKRALSISWCLTSYKTALADSTFRLAFPTGTRVTDLSTIEPRVYSVAE